MIELNLRYYMLPDIDGESWKKVKGYPNYLVSDFGRVKSLISDKILKPSIKGESGDKIYYYVRLSNKSTVKNINLLDLLDTTFKKYKKVVEYKEFKYNKNSEYIYDAY